MVTPSIQELQPMFADCPLCDSPMPLDADDDAFECTACDVVIELAETPAPRALPTTA